LTSEQFKSIRIKRGLSQKELGEIIYLSARQIRRIENGASMSKRVEIEMQKLGESD